MQNMSVQNIIGNKVEARPRIIDDSKSKTNIIHGANMKMRKHTIEVVHR